MKQENKRCLECGEPIYGRADKKFCDDQCRSNFNNRANGSVVAEMRTINNILRRNRKIIRDLSSDNIRKKVSRDMLCSAGFNFNYYTHTRIVPKGKVCLLCYDHGYIPIENDLYILVKADGNSSVNTSP